MSTTVSGLSEAMGKRLATMAGYMPRILDESSPRLKAGILIWANVGLDIVGRTFGEILCSAPNEAPRDVIHVALKTIQGVCDELENVKRWTGPEEPTMRQLYGNQVTMLTIGFPVAAVPMGSWEADAQKSMVQCWRTAWMGRQHIHEAILDIREWEEKYSMPALPPNREGMPYSDEEISLLARQFPAFLRKR